MFCKVVNVQNGSQTRKQMLFVKRKHDYCFQICLVQARYSCILVHVTMSRCIDDCVEAAGISVQGGGGDGFYKEFIAAMKPNGRLWQQGQVASVSVIELPLCNSVDDFAIF